MSARSYPKLDHDAMRVDCENALTLPSEEWPVYIPDEILMLLDERDLLKSKLAEMEAALKTLLEAVAPEGRYRPGELEPFFIQPVAKARAALARSQRDSQPNSH